MKYSEAEKQIKALSSKYDIDMSWGYFDVVYNRKACVVCVSGSYEYGLRVSDVNKFSKLPFSNKLYMILAELAMTPIDERVEEKKYYVKVYDSLTGYLNINYFTGKMSVDSESAGNGCKTKFTDKDINELKQRDDIPLDWNKVKLEETNED